MFNNSQAKLVEELVNVGGLIGIKARPAFLVMIDPAALTPELQPYVTIPTIIYDCWAGQATTYLLFTTEVECRAKLSRHLAT